MNGTHPRGSQWPIRIGSRGSPLARWQAEHVRSRLVALGHPAEIKIITTTGDRIQERRLEAVGGKGAFLKEIEEALLAGELDLAVHSLKDVPLALPAGLALCALLERDDPRDALLSGSGRTLKELPEGARIGTTSLRRQAQLQAIRADLRILDLRGNVETRIRKLRDGAFEAILLAVAGLRRLGRESDATEIFDPSVLLPAPGQGTIAIECRADDVSTWAVAKELHHVPTARAVTAERSFLLALGGGCNVPLGVFAESSGGDEIHLRGLVARSDGSVVLRGESRGVDPAEVGRRLGRDLLSRGAAGLVGRGVTAPVTPLDGWRVLLTRSADQASPLQERLMALGATVFLAPTIEIAPPRDTGPLDAALGSVRGFDWVLFTSPNAVRMVADRIRAIGMEPGALSGRRIGSVGPATTSALRRHFPAAEPVVQPESDFRAEGLIEALGNLRGQSVLLPTSDRARDALRDVLRAQGARVEVVAAYRTILSDQAKDQLATWLDHGLDLVVLASPSSVEGYLGIAGERGKTIPAVVMGPVTERAARAAGLAIRAVASPSTEDGLLTAIVALTKS